MSDPPGRVASPSLAGLRVLMVSWPTTGGCATCVRDLAGAGVDAGAQVTVACPADDQLAGWVTARGATWVDLRLRRSPEVADVGHVATIRRLGRRADVVHLHSSKAGADGRIAIAAMRSRPGCIFSPHGWSWLVGGRSATLFRAFERVAAHRADAIIAVSEGDRDEGARVLGPRLASRIRVIENGVDPDRFRPDGPKAARHEGPLIVCVGRLSEAKGQELLLRSVARTKTAGLRVRLVGDGEDREHLTRLASQLGIAAQVEFRGEVSDTAAEYRSADVVVVPSKWDAMSLALLEAMACGSAIVATRTPGSGALGEAGVIVAPDAMALADAIDALLADPDARRAVGSRARARALERFSLDRSLASTLDLWQEMSRPRR